VYDGTGAATLAPGNYTLSGVIGVDSVTLNDPTSGTYSSVNVGKGIAVGITGLQLGGAEAGDYTLASTTLSGNVGLITPATLTYTANPVSAEQFNAFPAFSGTVTGFVNGDSLAGSTSGTLAFETTATPASQAGTYPIDGSGLSAQNYVFDQASSNAAALRINTGSPTTFALIDGAEVALPGPNAPAIFGGFPNSLGILVPSSETEGSGPDWFALPGGFGALPPGSVEAETSVGTGRFSFNYLAELENGQRASSFASGALAYASSFTVFDEHDHPVTRFRRKTN
jgi:hypothetical protein